MRSHFSGSAVFNLIDGLLIEQIADHLGQKCAFLKSLVGAVGLKAFKLSTWEQNGDFLFLFEHRVASISRLSHLCALLRQRSVEEI